MEDARLLDRHHAHVNAWNDFDLGALGAIYDPECFIFDATAPTCRSFAELLRHLTPARHSYSAFTLRTFDQIVRVDERRDDRIGWIASRFEIEARHGEGVYRRSGRWTEIYEKRDDGWKLVHLHASDDP
jgi:ketosteroid isomerase-like protein